MLNFYKGVLIVSFLAAVCMLINSIYCISQEYLKKNEGYNYTKSTNSTSSLTDPEASFKEAIQFVMFNEGGFTFDSNDKGGSTKFGISARDNPEINLNTLTEDEAIHIYKTKYWDGTLIPHIKDKNLQIKFFDATVNMGYVQATKLLQRALNCTGVESFVDGIFGKKTLAHVNKCENPFGLQYAFIAYISQFYERLAEREPSQKIFLDGWRARAQDVVGDSSGRSGF